MSETAGGCQIGLGAYRLVQNFKFTAPLKEKPIPQTLSSHHTDPGLKSLFFTVVYHVLAS